MGYRECPMEGVGRLISVIMLAYNREELVPRAIESVLAQTYGDFEFIIVNNGSSDRSGAVADGYALRDGRIRVIHRERGNIGSGRNAGLDAAQGEWVSFIDDDDWCEPDYLEFLHDLATTNNAEAAICGAADKVFDEKRIMPPEEALIELFWRKKYNVAFPTKLLKASLFDRVRFSEASRYDDIELMPRIMGGANRVAYHGLPKYTFERHGTNNSAWTTDHSLLDAASLSEYLAVYRSRTEWLIAKFPDNESAWRYFEWSFMISMVEKVTRLGLPGCKMQLEVMKKDLWVNKEKFLSNSLILGFEKEWVSNYIITAGV